jgi:hypothetical protein
MSAIVPPVKTNAVGRVLVFARQFRIIPRIETYPAVVAFVQTPLGKLALLALFGLGERFFLPDTSSVLGLMTLIAIITFMPEYRRVVLSAAPIILLCMNSIRDPLAVGMGIVVIVTGMLLYLCAMRWPNSQFGKRPVLFLLLGFSALIAMATTTSQHTLAYSVLWSAVGSAASYVWFIAYSVTDRSSKPAKDWSLELAAFRPLWGSTNTPFPKGAAYLRRIEAANPEQLAITQLKGLKLLAWAIVLALISQEWNRLFHIYLNIPTSEEALKMSVNGASLAWNLRWESLILGFSESILAISIMGHRVIALCRLAGFNALRNTYRPLSSTTISEFFNRFYYYFKELLVDFFFYPVFLRYWKGYRQLRLIFATFAAVFFGNTFFHFTRDWQIIRDVGLWRAWMNYQASMFYCFVLASAVSISQLRKRGPKLTSVIRGRILPAVGVGLFYCLLNVFVTDERAYPFSEYLRYFASLFFIRF